MSVAQIILLAVLLPTILLVSWRSLGNPQSHGFYRFIGFLATLALIVLNLPYWFGQAFAPLQLLSWFVLMSSIVVGLAGIYSFRRHGGRKRRIDSPETLGFEETEHLVTSGLYRYIRHPMYASLLFLAWGGFLKRVSPATLVAVLVATIAFVLTARVEESENRRVWGEEYATYVKKSKMFLPFII